MKEMPHTERNALTRYIKAEALRLGFDACGIARATEVEAPAEEALRTWLAEGKQGEMTYMANYTDKRLDPRLLMEGARSIVCVALNYYPHTPLQPQQYQFAWYAYGKDYHDIMKEKLHALLAAISLQRSDVQGKVCCDTAPLLERYWARQAGLGWIGKNTQIILPHAGSTFFLGEIVLDAELDYDAPMPDRCGECTRCIEACPTHALEAPRRLNASRCLSYLTIEHRGEIPQEAADRMGNCIYGCDRCQQCCPWNRFARPTHEPALSPSEAFMQMTCEDWQGLTPEHYRTLFKGSPVKRAKYEGLMRNIRAIRPKEEEDERSK